MERIKEMTMNNNTRTRVQTKAKTRLNVEAVSFITFITLFVTILFFNMKSLQQVHQRSKSVFVLEEELNRLQFENSMLESKKADLLNIREIQKKALELGFVYNNDINYVK